MTSPSSPSPASPSAKNRESRAQLRSSPPPDRDRPHSWRKETLVSQRGTPPAHHRSVPHLCAFFLAQGWDSTKAAARHFVTRHDFQSCLKSNQKPPGFKGTRKTLAEQENESGHDFSRAVDAANNGEL